MKKGYCQIACVIDRSGSMASVQNDAIGGLNTFLKEQKQLPGKCDIHMVLFDHEYLVHYSGDIQDAQEFDATTFVPRGSTALLDAIGRTIIDVGSKLDALVEDEKPEKVIITILTDGFENVSNEFSKKSVSELIKQQQDKYQWEFVFLAADEKAIQDAHQYGFAAGSVAKYAQGSIGTRNAFDSMSSTVTGSRTKGK